MSDNWLMKETVRCAIRHEDFESHSGLSLRRHCDLLLVQESFGHFVKALDPQYPLAGIVTGGYLLALSQGKLSSRLFGSIPLHSRWTPRGKIMVKGSKVYNNDLGPYPRVVSLIDDVVTTGKSFEEASTALHALGIGVGERLVVMDRRSPAARADVQIRSLFLPGDFGLEGLTTI